MHSGNSFSEPKRRKLDKLAILYAVFSRLLK
jgi:hypothetical protein